MPNNDITPEKMKVKYKIQNIHEGSVEKIELQPVVTLNPDFQAKSRKKGFHSKSITYFRKFNFSKVKILRCSSITRGMLMLQNLN